MMKTHNPTALAYGAHFKSWQRLDMNHWREWPQVRADLSRRLLAVFERHLRKGGTITELGRFEPGEPWKAEPYKAREVAAHVANRVIGFGWKVQLNPR